MPETLLDHANACLSAGMISLAANTSTLALTPGGRAGLTAVPGVNTVAPMSGLLGHVVRDSLNCSVKDSLSEATGSERTATLTVALTGGAADVTGGLYASRVNPSAAKKFGTGGFYGTVTGAARNTARGNAAQLFSTVFSSFIYEAATAELSDMPESDGLTAASRVTGAATAVALLSSPVTKTAQSLAEGAFFSRPFRSACPSLPGLACTWINSMAAVSTGYLYNIHKQRCERSSQQGPQR